MFRIFKMIHLLWPSNGSHKPRTPVTLEIGEVKEYDFTDAADQIYSILSVLQLCDLLKEIPYGEPKDVFNKIQELVNDMDFGLDELQISEFKHIRVEFRDEMLALEVYVGV